MQGNRLHQLYSQSLSWSDHKLHRYLILRKGPTDVQLLLALALALLSHRLPFYGRDSTVLKDPEGLAEYLVQTCRNAADSDKQTTVSTLCSIAHEYIGEGLELDTAPIQLLVRTGAKICLLCTKQGATCIMARFRVTSATIVGIDHGRAVLIPCFFAPGERSE